MNAGAKSTNGVDCRAILAAFDKAMGRELHVLQTWPELTWQQLYNRLQWEDEPFPEILEPELQRRSVPGSRPWLRTRTRFRESEALIRTLEGHTSSVDACAFSPDATRVVTGSGDRTCKIWDAETGQELATLAGHMGSVAGCAFSPNGSRVVSASWDETCKIWDAETGQELATLWGHMGWVLACAFSPDGTRVVSASRDRTCKIWDAESGGVLATLLGHTEAVESCAFGPDGTRVVTGSEDKTCKIWDAESSREIATLSGHTVAVYHCAFSPDGNRVVTATLDATCKFWDAESGECIATLPVLGSALSLAHHPHKATAACGDAGGSLYVVELVGITPGPVVVTAVNHGNGPVICCPACREGYPLGKSWLDRKIACPNPECGLKLKVNPFVVAARPVAGGGSGPFGRWRKGRV